MVSACAACAAGFRRGQNLRMRRELRARRDMIPADGCPSFTASTYWSPLPRSPDLGRRRLASPLLSSPLLSSRV